MPDSSTGNSGRGIKARGRSEPGRCSRHQAASAAWGRLPHIDRDEALAPNRVRDTNHRDFRHARRAGEGRLDPVWVNIDATGHEHFVGPNADAWRAFGAAAAQVQQAASIRGTRDRWVTAWQHPARLRDRGRLYGRLGARGALPKRANLLVWRLEQP